MTSILVSDFPEVAASGSGFLPMPVPGNRQWRHCWCPGSQVAIFVQGQRLILESTPEGLAPPLDSNLEILDLKGKPVPAPFCGVGEPTWRSAITRFDRTRHSPGSLEQFCDRRLSPGRGRTGPHSCPAPRSRRRLPVSTASMASGWASGHDAAFSCQGIAPVPGADSSCGQGFLSQWLSDGAAQLSQ